MQLANIAKLEKTRDDFILENTAVREELNQRYMQIDKQAKKLAENEKVIQKMSQQLKQYPQREHPQKELIDQVTQYSEQKEAIEADQAALDSEEITDTQDDKDISPPIKELPPEKIVDLTIELEGKNTIIKDQIA